MTSDQNSGRVLALDFGKRRIGMAISDALGLTAQGLETFQRTTVREDLRRLAELAGERGATVILMGDPVHLSGRSSRQSERAREFAGRLEAFSGRPVVFWDERLTTVEAQRVLKESGVSSRKRAGAVDRLAAVLLLESYLEWRSRNADEGSGEE